MNIFISLIVVLWIIFWIYWLVSAIRSKRTVGTNLWVRGAWIRIALLVVILLFIRVPLFETRVVPPSILTSVIGLILVLAGFAFAVWARRHLGKNWGMPMSVKENPELVISGPYALVRHPIYTGFILAMIGTALAVGIEWFIYALVVAIYFIYSAKMEEKLMLKQFPNEYPAYMKRTKMIVPFIL
jgi:protein-S-isoprenylcysteine O-methyltransferase Ste14